MTAKTQRRQSNVHQNRYTHERTVARRRLYGYATLRSSDPADSGSPCGDGRITASGETLPARACQKGMVLGHRAALCDRGQTLPQQSSLSLCRILDPHTTPTRHTPTRVCSVLSARAVSLVMARASPEKANTTQRLETVRGLSVVWTAQIAWHIISHGAGGVGMRGLSSSTVPPI